MLLLPAAVRRLPSGRMKLPFVGVHVRVVLAWIDSGELPAHNVAKTPGGKRWKIRPEDLAVFEAARRAVPTPPVTRRRREEKPTGYTIYH